MNQELKSLLEAVRDGTVSPEEATGTVVAPVPLRSSVKNTTAQKRPEFLPLLSAC